MDADAAAAPPPKPPRLHHVRYAASPVKQEMNLNMQPVPPAVLRAQNTPLPPSPRHARMKTPSPVHFATTPCEEAAHGSCQTSPRFVRRQRRRQGDGSSPTGSASPRRMATHRPARVTYPNDHSTLLRNPQSRRLMSDIHFVSRSRSQDDVLRRMREAQQGQHCQQRKDGQALGPAAANNVSAQERIYHLASLDRGSPVEHVYYLSRADMGPVENEEPIYDLCDNVMPAELLQDHRRAGARGSRIIERRPPSPVPVRISESSSGGGSNRGSDANVHVRHTGTCSPLPIIIRTPAGSSRVRVSPRRVRELVTCNDDS